MTADNVQNEYFEWMYRLVCKDRYPEHISYKKLLMCLHNIEFICLIPRDRDRADNGIDLRYRFASVYAPHDDLIEAVVDDIEGPCSVLEMILALAIKCEEEIMDDPNMGDRTGQWFWGMIVNLGLGAMTNERFDRHRVEEIITRFMNRDYEPNGRGGLFTVRNCDKDLRDVEIWHQLCWYLDTIT